MGPPLSTPVASRSMTGPRRSSRTPRISTIPLLPTTDRRRVAAAVVLLAAAGAPASLAAQRLWRTTLYPYVSYSSIDGLWGAAHFGKYSPIGFAERPEPNSAAVTLDASASTQGSYAVVADAQAPAWWKGWRAALTLTAARANRLGYYGLGNATVYSADSVTPGRPYLYRVSRTTGTARLTVQRQVVGPLRLLAG